MVLLVRHTPWRPYEIRTLRVLPSNFTSVVQAREYARSNPGNYIFKDAQLGVWCTVHADYKTVKTHGVDDTVFDEAECGDAHLNRILDHYLLSCVTSVAARDKEALSLRDYYAKKVKGDPGDYLLFSNRGNAISETAWGDTFTRRLLQKHSGGKAPTNEALRKAYRYHWEQHQLGDSSALNARLRHTERTAKKYYEVRSGAQKKRMGKQKRKRDQQEDIDLEEDPEDDFPPSSVVAHVARDALTESWVVHYFWVVSSTPTQLTLRKMAPFQLAVEDRRRLLRIPFDSPLKHHPQQHFHLVACREVSSEDELLFEPLWTDALIIKEALRKKHKATFFH